MKQSTKNLVLCAMCAALTCVLAPISIPIGTVPISLATFAVMLSAAVLGPKLGVISQVVYLLLGCIGVPVFAGFSAGVNCIVGPTGGYLMGYLVLALVEGAVYRAFSRHPQKLLKKSGALIVSMVAGTAALYTMGTAWFVAVTHTPLLAALMACVVPFLLGDAVKIAVVTVLVPQLERVFSRINQKWQTAA
ncbi:MAG: biotin transporter BioY [Oscillospiraceae bacterium]|nr:biotin transporter BioY [Oscillospiraceae bacterium]